MCTYYFVHLLLVMVFYLIDILLQGGHYGLKLVLDGVVMVKFDEGKILVKHHIEFNDVGGMGNFGDNGSD